MTTSNGWQSLNLSRRGLLSGVALAAGGGALLGAGLSANIAVAANKVPQKTVSYQPTPKGNARCDNCAQWQPPSSCKLVAGAISPSGWCSIYAPKS